MPDYRAMARLYRELADAIEGEDGDTFATYEPPADEAPLPPEPDNDDPWADDTSTGGNRSNSRSSGRSQSRSGNSRSSRQGGSGGRSGGRSRGSSRSNGGDVPSRGTHTDGNGKEWTFGLSDAPECEHGLAAEVTKPGAKWVAWACPLGFSRTQYRDKCDLWEYQD